MEMIMSSTIATRIRELRKKRKLTQKQLAEETKLSLSAIKSYENGVREPNSKAMAALEQFFDVTGKYLRGETDDVRLYAWEDKDVMEAVHDALSRISSLVIETARSSDECSKKMTYDILIELRHILSLQEPNQRSAAMMLLQENFGITTRFIDSCLYGKFLDASAFEIMKKSRVQDFIAALNMFEFGKQYSGDLLSMDIEDSVSYPELREVSVYYQPASAGTGIFLDSSDYDIYNFPFDKVPLQTTFGVIVRGDSMEPQFNDNDLVFVRQQPKLEDGEIGIFVLNGDSYIKKLSMRPEKTLLLSLNSEYVPMEIGESDDLRVVGKVIGKLED